MMAHLYWSQTILRFGVMIVVVLTATTAYAIPTTYYDLDFEDGGLAEVSPRLVGLRPMS